MSEVVRTAYLLEPRPGPACDTLSAKTKESAKRIYYICVGYVRHVSCLLVRFVGVYRILVLTFLIHIVILCLSRPDACPCGHAHAQMAGPYIYMSCASRCAREFICFHTTPETRRDSNLHHKCELCEDSPGLST